MEYIITTFIVIIALLHIYFLVLEMFLWDKPKGMKVFGMTAEKAETTKVLAANQGLYNGFLAAGLLWSLFLSTPFSQQVQIFFLACIVVAGIYGAATASKKILFIQACPAAIALLLIVLF